MLKRNLSDSQTSPPPDSRRKLDEDIERNPPLTEHTNLAIIERNDLDDKILDKDPQIQKLCDRSQAAYPIIWSTI